MIWRAVTLALVGLTTGQMFIPALGAALWSVSQ